MKKIKILILIISLSSITIKASSSGIDISSIAREILRVFRINDFDKFLSFHAIDANNAKKIISSVYDHLKSISNNQEITLQKLAEFENRFMRHAENYKKLVNLEYKKILNTFNEKWDKALYLTSGITGLKFIDGLIRGNITIYFTIDNIIHSIFLEGIIITRQKELFICDKVSLIASVINIKYFEINNQANGVTSQSRENNTTNESGNNNRSVNGNNINIFNFILDLW